jgi:DNA-binding beta-propeller fold protein YncE
MIRPAHLSACAVVLSLSAVVRAQGSYVHFEGGQVHPIQTSADGTRLYAVNTADNRLSIWSLTDPSSPQFLRDIPVGLEPVSVTPRNVDEVWVANWLSDSVSVVSVSRGLVVDVLRAVDEPSDVAFAGSPQRAFVSASGNDEVRAYDAATRELVGIVAIFGRDPRALAVDPSGTKVYVLVLRSGNRTTIVPAEDAPPPPPPTNPNLPAAPQSGIVVEDDDPTWQGAIDAHLRDYDVVEIDAATLAITNTYSDVGTVLFDLAVDPVSGDLWVANTAARNLVDFEPNLKGHAIDSRVTRVVPGITPTVTPFDLNPGIDYGILPNPSALATALAEPTGIAFDAAAGELWVAAQGTDRVASVSTAGAVLATVEVGTTGGSSVNTLEKRGPRGLALHPNASRLYVLNRLSNTIGVVDTQANALIGELSLAHDPIPSNVRDGRKFLYDAKLSGNGTLSCAACHVDSEWDGIAWNLGDPGGDMDPAPTGQSFPFNIGLAQFHPMKGPMTTQTLRGLANVGPYHWRGDRVTLDDFQRAFTGVMGGSNLSTPDMDLFVDFMEANTFPPNPEQNLDRTYATTPVGANANDGLTFFQQPATTVFGIPVSCSTCHTLPSGTNRMVISTVLLTTAGSFDQFKVPHLRSVYRKDNLADAQGFRKLGFGLVHDGELQDADAFLAIPAFDPWPAANKDDIAAFLRAFDTGTAPAVGHQVHVDAASAGSVTPDVLLLQAQAALGDVDVVGKGRIDGLPRGLEYDPGSDTYLADDPAVAPLTWAALQAKAFAGDAELTLFGVPPGSGTRIGRDRDEDGALDGVDGNAAYGASSPGCLGELELFATREPAVGAADFVLVIANAQSGKLGIVGVGSASLSLPVIGITLLIDVTDPGLLLLPIVHDPSGFALAALPIPGDASLAGQTYYAQCVVKDDCGPRTWAATQGLAMTIAP